MKKNLIVMLSLISLAGASFASASESMSQINLQKSVKEQAISEMQSAVARHENMSKEEILADLHDRIEQNAAALSAKGLNVSADQVVTQLADMDKDTLVAMETQQLQSMMTSANAVFYLTRLNVEYLAREGRSSYSQGNVYGASLLLPFAILIDVVCLPFTFVGSAISGF